MVFVLLFSTTTLGQDLTKEEIVNELKEIVVITDKDIRLEKYDILAKKLGLEIAVADELIINSYSGSGMQTTRPFTVNTAWEIQWEAKAADFVLFQIYLYDGSGGLVNIVANQSDPGKGSYYSPKRGEYYLAIGGIGCDWDVKIVAVEK